MAQTKKPALKTKIDLLESTGGITGEGAGDAFVKLKSVEPGPPPPAPETEPEPTPPPPPVAQRRGGSKKAEDTRAPKLRTTARPGERGFKPFRGVRFASSFSPKRKTIGPDFEGKGKRGRADTRGSFDPLSATGGALLEEEDRKRREQNVVAALGE